MMRRDFEASRPLRTSSCGMRRAASSRTAMLSTTSSTNSEDPGAPDAATWAAGSRWLRRARAAWQRLRSPSHSDLVGARCAGERQVVAEPDRGVHAGRRLAVATGEAGGEQGEVGRCGTQERGLQPGVLTRWWRCSGAAAAPAGAVAPAASAASSASSRCGRASTNSSTTSRHACARSSCRSMGTARRVPAPQRGGAGPRVQRHALPVARTSSIGTIGMPVRQRAAFRRRAHGASPATRCSA